MRACRPRQWVKNLLVLSAPAAAGALVWPEVPERLVATFVAFCALSSSTYLLNDLHDRDEDRLHERRRTRPIAAGEVSVGARGRDRASRWPPAVSRSPSPCTPWLAAVGLGYVLLTGSYTLWWRQIAVADIAAVASGFILRALAGAVATDVAVSRWFLTVTSFGALFLVAGKRYAELRAASAGSVSKRASLARIQRALPAVRRRARRDRHHDRVLPVGVPALASVAALVVRADGDPVRAVAAALRAADRPRREAKRPTSWFSATASC